MGRTWAQLLAKHPGVELTAWVDLDIEKVNLGCEERRIDVPFRSASLEAALRMQPDFLVDATTPKSHCEVTLAALGAGIPVLGEKPMASSMADARRMISASENSGKLYMVSQSRRYNAGLRAFQSLIAERIAPIGILNADFYLGPHFGGFRDEMENPLLLDMAIHTFDAARYLSSSDPLSVYAEESNPAWSWYEGNASSVALFEMSNGLRFNYRGSWCAEGLMTSWEADWRAVGSRGTAKWDGVGDPIAEVSKRGNDFFCDVEPYLSVREPLEEGISGSLSDFLLSLDTGSVPHGECHDNIKSLAMVFGAIESARLGERVQISDL
jgi:predicted dehydrogenase